MEHEEYEMMYRAEDHHWWYVGMRKITMGLLDRYVGRGKDLSVLDAGCGTGSCSQWLKEYGTVAGIDLAEPAVRFCRERGLQRLAQASICELPFAAESFDLVTSFDVMSSCSDELAKDARNEFFRVLKPGGVLLLRLPAYQWLHGKHDQLVHTMHRYARGELKRLLKEHGFVVEHTTYANSFLFPLAAAKRLKDKVLPPKQACSDVSVSGGWTNPLFTRVLSAEVPFVRGIGLPFGLTVVGVARKP